MNPARKPGHIRSGLISSLACAALLVGTGFAAQDPPAPPCPPAPPESPRVIVVGSDQNHPTLPVEAHDEAIHDPGHGTPPARVAVTRAKTAKRQRTTAVSIPPEELKIIISDPMSTQDRAIDNLTEQLKQRVNDWLSPDGVPLSWNPPRKLLNRMFLPESPALEPLQLDQTDITVFRARQPAAFTPQIRHELLGAYHREVANQRLGTLGGVLAFTLVGLGLVAGYIRADEATKGYFTWPLRALAFVVAGGASVALIRFLL